MDSLADHMDEQDHDLHSFISLPNGDLDVDDDWFQGDTCGHLISCTDAARTLLPSSDAPIIESVWRMHAGAAAYPSETGA